MREVNKPNLEPLYNNIILMDDIRIPEGNPYAEFLTGCGSCLWLLLELSVFQALQLHARHLR